MNFAVDSSGRLIYIGINQSFYREHCFTNDILESIKSVEEEKHFYNSQQQQYEAWREEQMKLEEKRLQQAARDRDAPRALWRDHEAQADGRQ